MTLTRDEIIAIIKQEVECDPYADFKSDMLTGVEDAADAIMARLELDNKIALSRGTIELLDLLGIAL
jgi:hypothetical protein